MNRFIIGTIAVSILAGGTTGAMASDRRFDARVDSRHHYRVDHREHHKLHREAYRPHFQEIRHGWRYHRHHPHHRPVRMRHHHGYPAAHRADVYIESRHHGHFAPTVVGAIIGGAVGNRIGHGDPGATAVGAVIGAAAANHHAHR